MTTRQPRFYDMRDIAEDLIRVVFEPDKVVIFFFDTSYRVYPEQPAEILLDKQRVRTLRDTLDTWLQAKESESL